MEEEEPFDFSVNDQPMTLEALINSVARSHMLEENGDAQKVTEMLAQQGVSTISALESLTQKDVDWVIDHESLPLGQRALLRKSWSMIHPAEAAIPMYTPDVVPTQGELGSAAVVDMSGSMPWYFGRDVNNAMSSWVGEDFSINADPDVCFSVCGEKLLAHKAVLCHRSSVLDGELNNETSKSQFQHIELASEVVSNKAVMEACLFYIYTWQLDFRKGYAASVQDFVELVNLIDEFDLSSVGGFVHSFDEGVWKQISRACPVGSLFIALKGVRQESVKDMLLKTGVTIRWGESALQILGYSILYGFANLRRDCLRAFEEAVRPGTEKLTGWRYELSERNIDSILVQVGREACVHSIFHVAQIVCSTKQCDDAVRLQVGHAMKQLEGTIESTFRDLWP